MIQATTSDSSDVFASGQPLRRFIRRYWFGLLGGVIMAIVVAAAAFAPFVYPYSFTESVPTERVTPPSWDHPMGQDRFGRDVFARILYGARRSITAAAEAATLAIAAGLGVGLVSGYFANRWPDYLMLRLIDVQMSLPGLILAIVVLSALGNGFKQLIVVLAFVPVPLTSRVFRSAVLAERGKLYVESAAAAGCSPARVISVHLLPNILPTCLVISTAVFSQAILLEGALAFLGYGLSPPTPSLGAMLADAANSGVRASLWLALFPGLVVMLIVFAANALGDTASDFFDRRLN